MEPARDLHAETVAYMERANINDIFQVITSQLLLHKPDDPKQFIIQTLTTLQNQGAKPVLEDSDIETMFDIFDVTQQGTLTKRQAHRALMTVLGSTHPRVEQLVRETNHESEKLNKEQFISYVSKVLKEATPILD